MAETLKEKLHGSCQQRYNTGTEPCVWYLFDSVLMNVNTMEVIQFIMKISGT